MAAAGTSLFGTGSGSFRTRQDLQMISGLPPLVREKDRFAALLTLRNGTAKPMTVHLSAKAGGKTLEAKDVKLEAEGAAEVAWNAEAPTTPPPSTGSSKPTTAPAAPRTA